MQTKDFDTLVSEQVAAIQGGSTSLVDLTIGSILRAVVESYAAVAMWLQSLIIQLVTVTRASTSSGTDLDTWVADYGQTRLAADQATGTVTFSRFTATSQATIPAGSIVQTSDGSQTYTTQFELVIASGVSSGSVLVTAVNSGTAANAVVGGINKLGQAISGVDTVTNAIAFTNGTDAESDTALRARFIAYISSLSKATKSSAGYAAQSVQAGITYTLVENQTYAGATNMGYFYLVVDDGTGAPSNSVISAVYAAVDAVRPLTSTFGVFPPVVVSASIYLTIVTDTGYNHAATAALVSTAISTYVNSLALGASLPYTRIAQVAYGASSGVLNVSNVTLNGSTADMNSTAKQVIRTTSVVVA